MIRLRVVPPSGAPFDYEPRGESVIVGRALDCDLVLADAFLSRQHARLLRRAGQWYVEDLGSRNGTRLNGEPLDEARPLAAGDVIALSGSVLEVYAGRGDGDGGDRDAEAAAGPPLDASPAGPAAPGAPAAAPEGTLGDATYFLSARELLAADRSPSTAAGGETGGDLQRWADRLHLVNEVHRDLGRSLTVDEVLESTLDRVFDHLRPERGAVYLRRADGDYHLAARRPDEPDASFLRSRNLLREVVEKGLGALVLDARTDERFAQAHSMLDFGVRSLVAAPLFDGEESLGMIALDSRLGVRQFQREDLELLVSIASAAALRLRNLELAEEAAERRLLAAELALARRIQVALLPDRLPRAEGWELYGGNLPSRGVSGDFYEVVERPAGDGRRELFAVLADVSGKGMAASLLTASLEALLAPLIEQGLACDRVAARVSRLLGARTPPEKYATAVLAVLEPSPGSKRPGRVRYANAGHDPGLLVRHGGEVEELSSTGPPLGLLPDADYEAGAVDLAAGDLLVLYTDGLVEAADPDDEEYGLERLAAACRRGRELPLGELARAIGSDVADFVRGVPFADDRTLLLVRRLPGEL